MPTPTSTPLATPPESARTRALQALCLSDPQAKVDAAHALHAACAAGLHIAPQAVLAAPAGCTLPGRPQQPALVPPMQVPHRSPFTPDGLAALLHAVAHIEFNAINLALDVTARMALVPRTLEARGLDATPLIQARLRKVGTAAALRAVEILDVILRDEIGHVAVGNRWYGWLCAQQGLEPRTHYRALARQHNAPRLKPPFNDSARRAAGFTETELADLHGV